MKDLKHYLNEEDLKRELILVKKTEILKNIIKKEKNGSLEDSEKNEKEKLLAEGIDPKYKRTKFGEMLLLLINKILTQPKFSSYSYKDEFISNAIEKVFLYGIKNFDEKRLSKINNKPVKAFAYLTQIITNSIIATINEKKAEKKLLDTYFTELKDSEIYDTRSDLSIKNNDYDYEEKYDDCFEKIFIRFLIKKNNKNYFLITQHKKDVFDSIENKEEIYAIYLKPIEGFKELKKIEYEDVYGKEKKVETIKYVKFNNLYDIVKDVTKNTCKNNLFLDIIYPDFYKLSEKELKNILKEEIATLNIVKFYEKYIPKFPFQKSKKDSYINEKGLELWV